MTTTLVGEDCLRVRGTLLSVDLQPSESGLVALQLGGAVGSSIEVLADAAFTLQQLTAAFGSAKAAVDQPIELTLDVFGFPELRVFTPGVQNRSSSPVSQGPLLAETDPRQALPRLT